VKTKNRVIIALLIIGTLLFSVVQFVVVPHNNAKEQEYLAAQVEPTTHDLSRILPYKNRYIGNSSNTINLFYNLPLAEHGVKFQIFSQTLALEIDYQVSAQKIGGEKVHKALIYNSVAAFSLIDNLKKITYVFSDTSYEVTRTNIESVFGKNPSSLLAKEKWKTAVQHELENRDFVNQCMRTAILEKK